MRREDRGIGSRGAISPRWGRRAGALRAFFSTGTRVAGGLALALVALALAPAQAAANDVAGFFGNSSLDFSELPGEFWGGSPHGIGVNSGSGDIYVVDTGNWRIQRFDADGGFVSMWGRDVVKAGAAVDTDLGDAFEVCTHAPDCKRGVSGSRGGELSTAMAVAVDQATGTVYVNDSSRVQAFTADGAFLWAAGKDVIVDGSASDPGAVSGAQVCTVAADCKSADSTGVLGGEFGGQQAGSSSGGANGLAVSPVAHPVTGAGNVVVTDRANGRVQELTSTGEFVRAFGWDAVSDGNPGDSATDEFEICVDAATCKAGTAGGGLGQFGAAAPNRVAVDSTGAIYTVEHSSNFRVQKFTPQAGPPALLPTPANPAAVGGVSSADTPVDIAVGAGDHLLVLKRFAAGTGTPPADVAERRVVELDDAEALVEVHGARSGINSAMYLAVNTDSDEIYLSARAQANPPIFAGVYVIGESFPPSVSIGVGGVTSHGAQLTGVVNPGGPGTAIGFRASYRFEYRRVGDAGWTALSPFKDAGNGFDDVSVAGTLDSLEADTEYEARLVAFKPFASTPDVVAGPVAFSTPVSRPDVDAAFATGRGATTATLNARINPNGEATSYRFEYGQTAAYGSVAPAIDASAGDGKVSAIFSEQIAGLESNTTYHFRVVASNVHGTTESPDHTFVTRPDSTPPPGHRIFELVSPPDKTGGSGLSNWYSGPGSHGNAGNAAPTGDRYSPYTFYGASLADGGFSYGADATLAERTPAGWTNKPAFNRPGGQGTPEFAKLPSLEAGSEDFSLTAWTHGTSQMDLFPEQGEVFPDIGATQGSALREWESGRWEMAAPVHPDQITSGDPTIQIAADGGYAVVAGGLRGVGGPGDPTGLGFWGPGEPCSSSDGRCRLNVYIDDVTAGLSDSFPGAGVRSLVNACIGTGASRTAIPTVDGDGKLVAEQCPPTLAGRDARMVSPLGASVAVGGSGSSPGVISDDGSRVFFMSPAHTLQNPDPPATCSGTGPVDTVCPPQIYVRQRGTDGSVTVRWISRSEVSGQDASLTAAAVFEGATRDGDKVFFRTASPLTADDPNGGTPVAGGVRTGVADPDSVDLYMYDFPDAAGADPGDGDLTRISAGPTLAADANVSNSPVGSATSSLRALSEDGRRAYFVTAAPLTGVPAPTSGTTTTPGGSVESAPGNLYAYDAAQPLDRRWRFVARLPTATALGSCAASGSAVGRSPINTSANGIGGQLQFGSSDTNCVRATADGSLVAFFTDGGLTADDPDPASGDMYVYDADRDELSRISAPEGDAMGGDYECVNTGSSGIGTRCHAQPAVTAEGTRLIPLLQLVVDPGGADEGAVFFESAARLVADDQNGVFDVYRWRDGDLSLVSTGAPGADDALYRGNDRSGRNVYVSTRDRLTWQDHDAVLDVYTARSGPDAGITQPPPPVICDVLGDTCQGAGPASVAVPPVKTLEASRGGDASPGVRRSLVVRGLSRRALRRAARSGVLRLRVRSNRAGRVRGVARARVGGRSRRVARGSVRLRRAGSATLRLRLSRPAQRRLRSGRALRLRVRVTASGATARSMSVRLAGVRR